VSDSGVVLISTRSVAVVLVLVASAAAAVRFLDAAAATAAAPKVVLPTLAVGIVPGALATMLWRPRPRLTLLELIGFGAAFGFGLVHLLTIVAITGHVSAASVLVVMAIASALAVARVVQRSRGTIALSIDELIVALPLAALAIFLYFVGSPVDTFEDEIHIAIVRRLSQLVSPSVDNLYFAPGIVYTYPFPGTHYYMALIARLGDIDALFLYHKLRFFWGPAALVMLYLASRAVFGSYAVACAVTTTAVALVCTGIFATVPGLSWSQLVPYSHTSDVAMTVLLPAMLVVAFGYLQAESRRERAYFFTATAMLTVMLTLVHIREVVQFAAYMGCFLAVAITVRSVRPYARGAMVLLGLVLTSAFVYTAWQGRVAALVGDIVRDQRALLIALVKGRSLGTLLSTPVSTLLAGFVPYFELVWSGLTPFFLFAGPVVVLLFRRQPLVWLVSSSTLAYLAVMSVPLLAVPYIYLTYFEILYTPVRNVIFFVYLIAGAFLYAMVVALTRVDRTKVGPLLAGTLAGVIALLATLHPNRNSLGFFVPLLAAYGWTFVLAGVGPLKRTAPVRTVATMIVGAAAMVALWPANPPVPRSEFVNVRWTTGLPDARRAELERQFSLAVVERTPGHSAEVNVWLYRLHDLSRENIQALVTHGEVVDTHRIDRSTFTVAPEPPPAEHPFLGVEHVTWLQYPGWMLLIGMAVCVWVLGFLLPAGLASSAGQRVAATLLPSFEQPFYRNAVPFMVCLIPFALWSTRPTLSPIQAGSRGDVNPTPRAMIGQMRCVVLPPAPAPFSDDIFSDGPVMLPEQTACPPDYAVMEWVRDHVPVDAVFAINRWNPHLPSVFMPQQVVVFPRIERTFIDEDELFAGYYRFYNATMRKHRVQPFFNGAETPAERAAFVEGLRVTHVLVDPGSYDQMRGVLDRLPAQFVLRYSNAKWAVYEVLRGSPGARGT